MTICPGTRESRFATRLAVAVSAAVLLLGACSGRKGVENGFGRYLNLSPEARFVGKEVCGECHQENYTSYLRTQMGRSYKRATRAKSDADWDDPDPVHDPVRDLWYQPFARGEDLFVKEYRLQRGDTVFSRVEQIDYIVGSGQHTNSHVYEENGYLHQVPVTWYAQDAMWSLAPGFANNNARFSRPMREECVNCHNAKPVFVAGSENRFEYVPEGIDCEQCHGPGSVHVEAIRAGKVVDVESETDYTIVHPGKLPPNLLNDICSRCHLQAAEVIKPGFGPPDFRPGTPLSTFQNLFWPRQPDSATSFVMAFHPDRMEMSACFRGSWAGPDPKAPMTCLTCHNPHLAVDEVPDLYFDAVCRSCHSAAPQRTCREPAVAAGDVSRPCFGCHMPVSGTSDIGHVRITDHFIRTPDPERESQAATNSTFLRLASLVESDPGPVNRAEGFLTYFELVTDRPGMLDSAAVLLDQARLQDPRADLGRPLVRLWFLQEDWAAIRAHVRRHPDADYDDPWTRYRIGEAFAASDEVGVAITHVTRAVELAPYNVRFGDRLGRLLIDAGDLDRAIETFDRVLSHFPKYEPSWTNRGYARLLNGDFEGAESDYRRAMALDPDAEIAMASLASIFLNTGRIDEARALASELMRRHPGDPAYVRIFDAARE